MKTKNDLIIDFLLEINGQFDEHLYKTLELFLDYSKKWILVQEQKPDNFELVEVKTKEGIIFTANYLKESNSFLSNIIANNITHWRPIEYK